jgi:putative membrane protein insertion efficiency factor
MTVKLLVVLIRAYQVVLAPFFGGACRFLPSCSAYAIEAIEIHGAVRGSLLSLRRLSRCHPLGRAGVDPVPVPAKPETPISSI